MPRLRFRVLEGREVFREHAAPWMDLLRRSGEPSFFLRGDWLATWAATCAPNGRHCLAIGERDGRWVAGAPLTIGTALLGRKRMVEQLAFAGGPWFDRMEVPAETPEDLAEFLGLLVDWFHADHRSCQALSLRELPTEDKTYRILARMEAEADFKPHFELVSRAPMVVLDSGGRLSDRYARKLRASRRRLEGLGRPEFRFFLPSAEDCDRILAEIKEVEDRSWKGAQQVGVFRDGAPYRFFSALWRRLVPLGDIALATLRLDGRLVAYHWGFRHRGRFLAYNLAQLPEADEYTAGLLLLDHIVRHGRDLGFDIVDASRGSLDTPNFIGAYHGPVREHMAATIYGRGLRASVLSLMRHTVFPTARRLLGREQPAPRRRPEEPDGQGPGEA